MKDRTLRNVLTLILVVAAAACLVGEAFAPHHTASALDGAMLGLLVMVVLVRVFIG